ncbi:MAG: sodium/solute symporter [Luteitalea sp.]|nr:sodium/solute symporter [Luteitalea sp.]
MDLLVFVLYLAALAWIGKKTAGRIGTAEDFHLCGRSLGRVPAALSLAATEFSGSGLIGGAGLAYAIGVSGVYWNLVAVPAWIVVGVTAVVTLRKLSLDTLPGFIGRRYGISTRRLVAILQIVEAIVFTAVQILVSAIAMSTLFDLDRTVAAAIVTASFVAYTVAGGLWAVVWADVLQYVILMSGIVIGLLFGLNQVGGVDGLQATLPEGHFDLRRLGLMEPLAWMALCVYSYSTDPGYLQRAFATTDYRVARFAYVFTGVNYLVFGVCVAGMGMIAAALMPGLLHQDEALPALINEVLPSGLKGFFVTAILATTMSTASSWLAAASSLLVQDLYQPLSGPLEQARLLRVSRIATLLLAAASLSVALVTPGVVDAVVFSTLVAPAAVFAPLMLGLYWKAARPAAGFASVLAGALAGVASHALLYKTTAGILGNVHPLFFGPSVGLLVFVAATLITRATSSGRQAPGGPRCSQGHL